MFRHSLRVLILNCTSGRSETTFLTTIKESLGKDSESTFFDHVIFPPNVTYASGNSQGGAWQTRSASPHSKLHSILDLTAKDVLTAELSTQQAFSAAWSSLVPEFDPSHIHVLPSIEHAVREVEKISTVSSKSVQALVTGSLHLVGGVIEVTGLSELAL